MPSFHIRIDHEPGNFLIPAPYRGWLADNSITYGLIAHTSTGANPCGWDHYTITVADIALASVFKILFPEVTVEGVFE